MSTEINARDPKLTLRIESVLVAMERKADGQYPLSHFLTVYRGRATEAELVAWCAEFNDGSHLLPKGTVERVKRELGLITEGKSPRAERALEVTRTPAPAAASGQSTAAPVRSREEMRSDAIASLLALGQGKREARSRVEAALSSREPFADAGALVKLALRQTIPLHSPTPAKPKATEAAHKDDGASPWAKHPRGPRNDALRKVRPLLERIAAAKTTTPSERQEYANFLWAWLGSQNPAPQKVERFIRWIEQLTEARQEEAAKAVSPRRKKAAPARRLPAPSRARELPVTIKPVRMLGHPLALARNEVRRVINEARRERDRQTLILRQAEDLLARIDKIGGAS